MLYKLLGMIVLRVGKRVLQRKYGSTLLCFYKRTTNSQGQSE